MTAQLNDNLHYDAGSTAVLHKPLTRIQDKSFQDIYLIKKGVWLFLLLLLFEGALRKWFLPSLATPLLVIRDPLAIWLVYSLWQRGLFPANFYASAMITVGLAGVFTAVLIGHGNILVALYGARIFIIHFPLIFVIGRVFDRDDVLKIGKFLLWVAVPMAVLIALQFYSPQSAWVNRGVGDDVSGAGFGGAMGYFRPPATFSFTNGTTLFFSLVACFVVYFWVSPNGISRILLVAATISLLAAIPLSISRTLFFQVIITVAFTTLAALKTSKYLARVALACVGGVLVLALLSQTGFFQTATEAFLVRFDTANEQEGGLEGVLLDRYLGGLIGALTSSTDNPFFGRGLGMGTNVGSMLLVGQQTFLIAEGEWGRLVGELGALMGLTVIFLRLGLCVKIALASFNQLVKGDLLPWVLLSFGLLTLPQSQWAQPTSLGFSVMIGGLMIASLRTLKSEVS